MRVVSWNIGFGGLGADAEFRPDGGKRLLPASRQQVEHNVEKIGAMLAQLECDVLLLQEVTRGGVLSRGVDLFKALEKFLPQHETAFCPDVKLLGSLADWLAPHGMALFHRGIEGKVIWNPFDIGGSQFGLVKKVYGTMELHGQVAEQPVVFGNFHLDPYSSSNERKHLGVDLLQARAQTLWQGGQKTVLFGGDWNMPLQPIERPHKVPSHRLKWAIPLPRDRILNGWHLLSPDGKPTNRTLEAPLTPGHNFLSAIDGFLASPDCPVTRCETIDLGFEHADHNPVVATLDPLLVPGHTNGSSS